MSAVVTVARTLLDTPFQHQGRLPGVALDCVGLVVAVATVLGYTVVDRSDYGRAPLNGELETALDSQPCLQRIDLADMAPGDVLLARFKKRPQHVAIYTGAGIIHAYGAVGKVVEHDIDAAWRSRIVRAYRFVEVNHE